VEEQIAEQITASPIAEEAMHILGELWWLFIIVAGIVVFKETIKSFVTSIMVLRSGTYEVDDVVILEGTPARIVRMGIWKTTFYVYRQVDGGKLFHSTRDVMNEELPQLHIEIPQQRMDQLIPDEFLGRPGKGT
jgi:predicted HAD superfamily phosphohydrolase